MIYRIQYHKDGAIASCSEVESQHKDGGLVLYVEADSKEAAIKIARGRWEALNGVRKRLLGARQAEGKCITCGAEKEGNGVRCAKCKTRVRTVRNELKEISRSPNREALLAERAQALSAARRERVLRLQTEATQRASEAIDKKWDAGQAKIDPQMLSVFRQCLRAYDRDPANFRAWLLKMLGQEAQAMAVAAE